MKLLAGRVEAARTFTPEATLNLLLPSNSHHVAAGVAAIVDGLNVLR